jgi:hypothetical protein
MVGSMAFGLLNGLVESGKEALLKDQTSATYTFCPRRGFPSHSLSMVVVEVSNETVVLIGTLMYLYTTVWKWLSLDGRLKDRNPAYRSCTMLSTIHIVYHEDLNVYACVVGLLDDTLFDCSIVCLSTIRLDHF